MDSCVNAEMVDSFRQKKKKKSSVVKNFNMVKPIIPYVDINMIKLCINQFT